MVVRSFECHPYHHLVEVMTFVLMATLCVPESLNRAWENGNQAILWQLNLQQYIGKLCFQLESRNKPMYVILANSNDNGSLNTLLECILQKCVEHSWQLLLLLITTLTSSWIKVKFICFDNSGRNRTRGRWPWPAGLKRVVRWSGICHWSQRKWHHWFSSFHSFTVMDWSGDKVIVIISRSSSTGIIICGYLANT